MKIKTPNMQNNIEIPLERFVSFHVATNWRALQALRSNAWSDYKIATGEFGPMMFIQRDAVAIISWCENELNGFSFETFDPGI